MAYSYRKQIQTLKNNRLILMSTLDAGELLTSGLTANTDNFKYKSKYFIKGLGSKESSLSEAFLPDTSSTSIRLGLIMVSNAPFKNEALWSKLLKFTFEISPVGIVWNVLANTNGIAKNSNIVDLGKNTCLAKFADMVATEFISKHSLLTEKGCNEFSSKLKKETSEINKHIENITEGEEEYVLKYNSRTPQNEVIHISNVSAAPANKGALIATSSYEHLFSESRFFKVLEDLLKKSDTDSSFIKQILRDDVMNYVSAVNSLHIAIAKVLEKVK